MSVPRRASAVAAFAAIAIAAAPAAVAQNRGVGPASQSRFGASLPTADLVMRFHDNARCVPIASPYGSPTRYDGSSRRTGGGPDSTHGGIDLTLAKGTPLLAIAPGTVFGAGQGGQMEGNFLWLLHLPELSGAAFAFLSKYQHLAAASPLGRGEAVTLGRQIARSGLSGTVGGHYGPTGYAHLHLTVRAIPTDKVALAAAGDGFSIPRDSIQIDPLTVYVPGLHSPADAAALPAGRKQVVVGYVDAGGMVRPSSARAVWPVSCP